MKRMIGYILAWTMFWMGHWTSLIMGVLPSIYSTYRWLMHTSMKIQDWAGNETPWRHVNGE